MLKKVVFAIIVITGCIIFSCNSQVTKPENVSVSRTKVLYIGSSYFGWNSMPAMVELLAKATGKDMFSYEWIEFGRFLSYFANHPEADDKINNYKWDYVILQGTGINIGYFDTHQDFYPYGVHPIYGPLETFSTKARENYSGTKTVYCMPWAFEDGILWIENQTDDYFAMQQKIYDNTLVFADSLDLTVSPVGWAWNEVLKEHPDIKLHDTDLNHPSAKGSYLMACVVYVTIFQEALEDVGYHFILDEEEAYYLQSVASSMVLDNLSLWNISSNK
ncbi:MAG: hypothetical protein GY863_08350 [bacterium]|nr:hypothetical protein [bacterium]